MSTRIVRIDSTNLALLERVDDDCFDERVDLERAKRMLTVPTTALFVSVVNDAGDVVVGQLLAHVHHHPDKPSELYLDDLAVAERLRRKGIARALIDTARAWGQTHGATELWVGTEPENDIANAFYAALGLKSRTAVIWEGGVEER